MENKTWQNHYGYVQKPTIYSGTSYSSQGFNTTPLSYLTSPHNTSNKTFNSIGVGTGSLDASTKKKCGIVRP